MVKLLYHVISSLILKYLKQINIMKKYMKKYLKNYWFFLNFNAWNYEDSIYPCINSEGKFAKNHKKAGHAS